MLRGILLCCAVVMTGCADRSPRGTDRGVEDTSAAVAAADRSDLEEDIVGNRKIVYEAKIELAVRDFAATEAAVPRLVEAHGGYLSQTVIDRTSGEHRSARWQARIPVPEYGSFLEAVSQLGVAKNLNQSALDVSEDYVDLEARIASKQQLEQRIIELLKNPKGEIAEVIKVEGELARVRGDIEQMQGRLRYLANRTELTTVDISAREQLEYIPPAAPTFLARTDEAWTSSLVSLRKLVEDLAVVLVAALPWLAVFLVLFGPPLWFIRRKNLGNGSIPTS